MLTILRVIYIQQCFPYFPSFINKIGNIFLTIQQKGSKFPSTIVNRIFVINFFQSLLLIIVHGNLRTKDTFHQKMVFIFRASIINGLA